MPPRKRKLMEEIEDKGVFAERVNPSGRRMITLREGERKELLKTRQIERSIALFLDLEDKHTWEQIAQECGLSVRGLKDLTKTEEFIDLYSQYYADLGHDPRLKATQAQIADMLPDAIKAIKDILSDANAPASARIKAAFSIMDKAGIQTPTQGNSDRTELTDFLLKANVNIENVTVNVLPQEYTDHHVEEYLANQVREINPLAALQASESIIDVTPTELEQEPAEEEVVF